jgi:NTE family protein
MPARAARTALVLSAGGVRGAYQVGVIAGLVDLLGRGPVGAPLFDIFTGSSVGAINAAYLAANADRSDHAIEGLIDIWTKLDFDELFRFTPLGLWGWPRVRLPGIYEADDRVSRYIGRSLFDPRPVERFLNRVIPWDRLHANVRAELVRGLMIAALDICDGTTMVFTELAEGVTFRPYPYLTDRSMFTAIKAEHVLAATAMPFIFPARRVADRYYMDGAIRFETPIIPALRAGARRVVAISLLDEPSASEAGRELVFPGVFFLVGQLLSALLLSPLLHDIDRLHRNNRTIEVLAETLDAPTTAEVIANLESEVPPGRPVPTLVFQPSESIEAITSEFLHDELRRGKPLRRAILGRLADLETGQALVSSFLCFDGRLAARLVELGRRDAHAEQDRILAFFRA